MFNGAVHTLDSEIIIEFLKENGGDDALIPDLIFLDLDMPGFSGWDFLEHFEKLSPHLKRLVSIYIVSSSIDERDRVRSKHFPFVKDFISKPIKIEKLAMIHDFHKRLCA